MLTGNSVRETDYNCNIIIINSLLVFLFFDQHNFQGLTTITKIILQRVTREANNNTKTKATLHLFCLFVSITNRLLWLSLLQDSI